MGKKKTKDFNKVKLKLGRTLKRQNETVIDLSRRKIILPKEKDVASNPSVCKEAVAILDEHIKKLHTTNDIMKFSALSSIRSILAPFSTQVTAVTSSHSGSYTNEDSIKLLNHLFGWDFALQDMNFQFGDILYCLCCISQTSQSPQVVLEVVKVCKILVIIFSSHPRIHAILGCIERVASSLLRRPEMWCRHGGSQILSSVCEGRRLVLSALSANMSSPSDQNLELQLFTDSKHQLYRSTTYPRLLIRQFESLNESSSMEIAASRVTLVHAVVNFLQDRHYTLYATPMSFGPNALKIHPFLEPADYQPEVPSDFLFTDSPHPLMSEPCLLSTWMLLDIDSVSLTEPVKPESSNQGLKQRRGRTNVGCNAPPQCANPEAFYDRKLAVCLLNEGIRFLDEIVHTPKVDAVFGLIYVIRSLRVFSETEGTSFFSKSPTEGLPDVSSKMARFCCRLRELLPLDVPGDALLRSTGTQSAASGGGGGVKFEGGACLSRKELKKVARRSAKRVRQEEASGKTVGDEDTGCDQSTPDSGVKSFGKKLDKSTVLTHLLKQHILELWWNLIALRQIDLGCGGSCEALQEELATLLLATRAGDGSLDFLNSTTPALAWRWMRALDYCLLYRSRIRKISDDAMPALSKLVAPMLVVLAHILHHWVTQRWQGATGAFHTPRIVVRCAGILTAFICQELKARTFEKTFLLPAPTDCPNAGGQAVCDVSWIRDSHESSLPARDPFACLITDLCVVVARSLNHLTPQTDDDTHSGSWIWAATCLLHLVHYKYPAAVEAVSKSADLQTILGDLNFEPKPEDLLQEPLVYLPSPDSGLYRSMRGWKCTSIERIVTQDSV